MNDQLLISYLLENHPYLYDIEMGVRKIQATTGFGEISSTIRVAKGVVDKGQTITVEDKLYRQRRANVL